jgi:hypothetical protein
MRNIELLELSEESADAIVKKMRKYTNIYGLLFKIFSASEDELAVSVSQINPDSKKLFDRDELIEIAHDVFDESLLPTQHLKVACNTIEAAPTKGVDPEWIKRRMYQTSTKLKQMARDFGFPKNGMDDYLNGTRPLSKVEKALFFYYLEYRALLKEKGQNTGQIEDEGED